VPIKKFPSQKETFSERTKENKTDPHLNDSLHERAESESGRVAQREVPAGGRAE